MGKVRNVTIKKFGRALVEKFPEKFSQDYDENKQILTQVAEISSKKLKNRIAGYITSLMTRPSEIIHEPSIEETISEKIEEEIEKIEVKKETKKEAPKKEEIEKIEVKKETKKEAPKK